MGNVTIVVGHSGQDGTILAEQLSSLGDTVVGVSRTLHNISDAPTVHRLVAEHRPYAIYYLAAHHGSSESMAPPQRELDRVSVSLATHVTGAVNFLLAITDASPLTRFFYAGSSRVFGNPSSTPQDEDSPFAPNETYGITKTAGIQFCRMYRQQFGVFAATGILYNHESPLRPPLARRPLRLALVAKCPSMT